MKVAREFLQGIIDYAGLFPPQSLDMQGAVESFAKHLAGDDRDLLGRFILPSSRLSEFSSAHSSCVKATQRGERWRLSVIPGAPSTAERERVEEFNRADAGANAVKIDAVEMPVKTIDDVNAAAQVFGGFELFLEPAGGGDPELLLDAIAAAGANAKLRTGGTAVGSVPHASAVTRFIELCAERDLRFKATAGLHHALCGVYPLTYAPDSPRDTMYGYLNVFLVAAFQKSRLAEASLCDLLQECDISSIVFDECGVMWRGNRVSAAELNATRKNFSMSFGSCSFSEPVQEARHLHLI